ncbi:hypothetical protein D3C75_1343050 [compost metagenome]
MPWSVLFHLSIPVTDDRLDQPVEIIRSVVIARVLSLQLREAAVQRGQQIETIG